LYPCPLSITLSLRFRKGRHVRHERQGHGWHGRHGWHGWHERHGWHGRHGNKRWAGWHEHDERHRVQFFVASQMVASMETHVTHTHFGVGSTPCCRLMYEGADVLRQSTGTTAEALKGSSRCKNLKGDHDIQDVAMHTGAPAAKYIRPALCDGLNVAYMYGAVFDSLCRGLIPRAAYWFLLFFIYFHHQVA